ncbi:hypothetical protein [Mesorhizobium sp. KR9-304]|uniref:hypothetical protein n=1 Tax=Mesorhizobium sp. KR9-304 TaxID=3156614 RepID=UPI0032B62432
MTMSEILLLQAGFQQLAADELVGGAGSADVPPDDMEKDIPRTGDANHTVVSTPILS